MRTDSPYLSASAINMAKSHVMNVMGSNYLADDTKSKSLKSAPPKNAQEAHEAIRPADSNGRFRTPQDTGLDEQQLSLYTLIYKRTIASVMATSISESKTYTVQAGDNSNKATIRFSATSVLFDGYLKIYGVESISSRDTTDELKVMDHLLLSTKFTRDHNRDDDEEPSDGDDTNEKIVMKGVQGMAHATRAPSRFTEASFIKELDDIGIGRPSTYSKILLILKERGYIMVDKQTIIPTLTGMVVSSFLEKHFSDLVEPQFTASMEDSLDAIAHGAKDKLDILNQFYLNDNPSAKSGLLHRVQHKIQNQAIDQKSSRILDIPFLKGIGRLQINRSGAYVESFNLTESGSDNAKQYRWKLSDEMNNDIREITTDSIKELMTTRSSMQGNSLGAHPNLNKQMVVRSGRYGTYLQIGDDTDKNKSTHSLPAWLDSASCTIDDALQFASLPLSIGNHPDLNEPIVLEVSSRKLCASIPTYSVRLPLPDHTYINDVTVDVALQYLPTTEEIMRSQRLLGEDEHRDNAKVWLKKGRFGYYVRCEDTIAGIDAYCKQQRIDPFDIDLSMALNILHSRGKQLGSKKNKTTKKSTKKEKEKGADTPKKLNAYQLYVKEATGNGKSLKDAAASWKLLDEPEKAAYQEKAVALTAVDVP